MLRRDIGGRPGTRYVPWVVLAVGLATTFVLWGSILKATRARNDRDFKVATRRIAEEMNAAVRRQVSVLHAAAGTIAADPEIDRSRFRTFYQHLALGADARLPQAIGLSVWRPWERRGELEVDAVQRGVTDFRLRPTTPRAEAHAVMLIEPLDDGNVAAPGFDMHADPVRKKAMDAAKARGDAVMTSWVELAKDKGKKPPAFLIYVPVRKPDDSTLIGYVYSGIHAQDLFGNVFPSKEAIALDPMWKGLSLRLWSGERKPENLVFSYSVGGDRMKHEVGKIELSDVQQTLNAEFVANTDFGTPGVIRPFVLPVGGFISIMLFLLARNLVRAHEASEQRAAEQWLLSEVGRLTAAPSDEEAILEEIAQVTARNLDVVCRIDLREPDGSFKVVSTRTEHRETLAAIERDHPRWEHDPYLRTAIETGTTQRADGYVPRDELHRERHEQLGIGPIVVVPMRVRDRAIGAITLTRAKGRPALTNDAVALAEAISGRLSLAVDNARLYRAAQQEIAERTAAEAEVRRLNEDLEEIVAERTRDLEASNRELESFCYSVSHDLRTPLRSLDGFGRALKEDYGDRLNAEGLDYIERIRASTKRMDELITALLTLSRLTRREIVPIDVDVTSMVRDQMHDLDPQGKIDLRVQEGLTVHADPRMLAVVFDNLLTNAIKFAQHAEPPRVEVGQAEDGAIFVRDNGAGFDMAYANKLFLPFERLHSVREFPGHGIGLATVDRILRRHGGDVRAEGKPGEGATFYVRFPQPVAVTSRA